MGEGLAGRAIGVTADRRREELAELLERRGARVLRAPTMRTVTLTEDAWVKEATDTCVQAPIDIAIATTGVGLRGWLDAAADWGLRERLVERLADASLFARGPKARGAVRAAGLGDAWTPASETSEEIRDHLLARGVDGQRIALQLHGDPLTGVVSALRDAGATVAAVPVYRWELPEDLDAPRQLVGELVDGAADAVTFTSAPSAAGLLRVAADVGREEAVLDAFRRRVVAACVGPVTAAPLEERGVPTFQPQRARTKALVEALAERLGPRP